jgi:hypothetical protein
VLFRGDDPRTPARSPERSWNAPYAFFCWSPGACLGSARDRLWFALGLAGVHLLWGFRGWPAGAKWTLRACSDDLQRADRAWYLYRRAVTLRVGHGRACGASEWRDRPDGRSPGRALGRAPGGRGFRLRGMPGLRAGEGRGCGLGVAGKGGWELVLGGSEGGVRGVATWSAP